MSREITGVAGGAPDTRQGVTITIGHLQKGACLLWELAGSCAWRFDAECFFRGMKYFTREDRLYGLVWLVVEKHRELGNLLFEWKILFRLNCRRL